MAAAQSNWSVLIAKIMQRGMTQAEIAAACGVSQRQISHLARGETLEPGYSLGSRLIEMAKPVRIAITHLVGGSILLSSGKTTLVMTAEEVEAMTLKLLILKWQRLTERQLFAPSNTEAQEAAHG